MHRVTMGKSAPEVQSAMVIESIDLADEARDCAQFLSRNDGARKDVLHC